MKRDVRVKALEVAEAVKRREQKKQNEREMRKAAAELERERVKQEREQKLKQMEQKKKTDARKRQWEDDGRKEKEKKKKFIEEPRKQQKQLGERMHAGNSREDASQKDPVSKHHNSYCLFYNTLKSTLFFNWLNHCRMTQKSGRILSE